MNKRLAIKKPNGFSPPLYNVKAGNLSAARFAEREGKKISGK